jgi:DNA polymerase elongation subunit (family B)
MKTTPTLHKVNIENLTSAEFEIPVRNPRILLFDIETAPNLSFVWGHYEQNVLAHVREWYALAWCAKWLDGKPISRSLPDYAKYKPGSIDDKALCRELWELLDRADIVIAHNGDSFDIKKMNARFLIHGFGPA